jgi:photosystem II stability/assembly factor-like uncharacterized protein
MAKTLVFLIALASLTISSGLRAQYQWKVLRPSRVDDTFYRAPLAISCNGDNCLATEIVFSPSVGNTNVILSSHDGGVSWIQVAKDVPQWDYYGQSGKRGITYESALQIDSLTAIIGSPAMIVITRDGWKTWTADSTYAGVLGSSPRAIRFAGTAEGMIYDGFGLYWSSVDSGNTWKRVSTGYGSSFETYGDSTFRVFERPNLIFTTRDNWSTRDTTHINLTGPLADTTFHPQEFVFGRNDSVAVLGWTWDAFTRSGTSKRLALSNDLGQTWRETDLPMHNGLWYANTALNGLNWDHMVLAGNDSVGRIVHSTDRGLTWRMDTVPMSNGIAYHTVFPVAISGSGRVLAGVQDTTSLYGSANLVYLEERKASVNNADRNYQYLYIQAYPNPVHALLSLKLYGMIVGPVSTLRSRIYDVLGRTVKDLSKQAQSGSNGDFSEFEADVSDLAPGVYFVSYTLGGAEYVRQFLKY